MILSLLGTQTFIRICLSFYLLHVGVSSTLAVAASPCADDCWIRLQSEKRCVPRDGGAASVNSLAGLA